MNKAAFEMTVLFYRLVLTGLMLFSLFAFPLSLFVSVVPGESGHAFFSTFLLPPWLLAVAFLAFCQLAIQPWIVFPKLATYNLVICGALLLRVWANLADYPEVVAMTVICALVVVLQKFVGATPYTPPKKQVIANVAKEQKETPQEERVSQVVEPSISFSDVAGMTELKATMLDAAHEVIGATKRGEKSRNGILLTGKPGNGKTMMAEALAGEVGLPFMPVTFGEVVSKWIGDTPERVKRAFTEAKAAAPCVLFLDEVDSLLSARKETSSNEESAKIVNVLLTELVNIRKSGVIVVAATNFVDRLDPAAIREGRFDFKIEVPPPDAEARAYLIKSKGKGRISDATVAIAVRRWEGFSVARINAVMEEAIRMPKTAAGISFDLLKKALRKVQGRAGKMPENTPTLDKLAMSDEMESKLTSLANRMDRIAEIEAMGGSVPRGVLFYGPPGTGKTLMARALAKTADWAFLPVSGMDLMASPERIERLMDEASDLRPCIVFIDEADDVFKDRRYSNNPALTNKLLAMMDGAGGHIPDVLFIAATNHANSMDEAAVRGGRFTEKIEFGLPDEVAIEKFLESWYMDTPAELSDDLGFQTIAHMLLGQPIANVKEIMQAAVNHAIDNLQPGDDYATVTMMDIQRAKDTVCPA
ncbi:AAA family ATPase [Azonexus hydrophilus]|uniref:AAA family ATPase n=1 Tax=Azonexus hydrophilus TaxID=418702 RepID=A0ABZ2XM89_9RHOO